MNSARRIALDILNQVAQGRHTLDHWLEAADGRLAQLNPADRALVHALVYGTLRWQGRLDYLIDRLAKKPRRIDPMVRTILRMALFQMHHLDRVPDSAAVNSAVDLSKQSGHAWAAGFVNGLLRRAAITRDRIDWPDMQTNPDLAVAARYAIPRWLAARWIQRQGLQETERLCEHINTIPSITIRTNTLKTDRQSLIDDIQAQARRVALTRYSPEGIIVSGLNSPLPRWTAFQKGWFQVQDEAAQIVSHLLSPLPGETVWDACAGMGTKTAHLAQLMDNKGTLLATDLTAYKLDRLQDEMQRLGVTITTQRCMDLSAVAAADDLPLFDRILVDAPCSGLGVLQKNPDGKWKVTRDDLAQYSSRQLSILETTCRRLRPEGMLVYAVCSFEPEENQSVVKAFLQKHPDFVIHRPSMKAVTEFDRLLTPQGWLSIVPHRHGMDGFFAAAFVKKR
ncbi:MAG: 16S rRNA (cytosine(967)-C(5))-methyltransferase RsmB [Desulfobacteraceae bacterium]|nr:MAG: 16S rRNA (cytosine(967)-C(5))-methyltransferase RsmB [Desulfobacteraceae bacterium]